MSDPSLPPGKHVLTDGARAHHVFPRTLHRDASALTVLTSPADQRVGRQVGRIRYG
jgi:hypothetical protein